MSVRQIYVGLITEGTTDIRFLSPIVEKLLNQIAFDCTGEIDIELILIEIVKTGLSFNDQILEAAKKACTEYGISILCAHTDADSINLENTLRNKINPAITLLEKQSEEEYCKILVPIIPAHETEAWMLADKNLLKKQLGTNLSDSDLGLNKDPENFTDPKKAIENAITIVQETQTKRKRGRGDNITISDLYLPIGQEIELEKLETLPSFQHFKENLINAFRKLNYLH